MKLKTSAYLVSILSLILLIQAVQPLSAQSSTVELLYSSDLKAGDQYMWQISPVMNDSSVLVNADFATQELPDLSDGGTISMEVLNDLTTATITTDTNKNDYFGLSFNSSPVRWLVQNDSISLSLLGASLLLTQYSFQYQTPDNSTFYSGVLLPLFTPLQVNVDGNVSSFVDVISAVLSVTEQNQTATVRRYAATSPLANVSMELIWDLDVATGITQFASITWGTLFSVSATLTSSQPVQTTCKGCGVGDFVPFWGLGVVITLPVLVVLQKKGLKGLKQANSKNQ